MSSRKKRKHGASPTTGDLDDRILHIQAYEADIRCSPTSARSLEANGSHIGEALIKHSMGDNSEIWLDRYDARLILGSSSTQPGERRSPSPSGWSDIPSDTEDTFFFGQAEAEDYRRDKRRRLIESAREERLRALEQLEPTNEQQETYWASDEEPDKVQKNLMQRTALHIQSSPNPAHLEMRILANHGADHRFAFLRGRWSRYWKAATEQARTKILKRDEPAGLGGLAGYGSDDDSDADHEERG
ncbi:hypothetical protein BDM02DRAFT_2771199 [Thelephora ganbajun]|uniref:Uncharacterized protein n=1 Tax=Thelephora ganbajun TaxID=370292 RepID=A0ACB6ZT03_THEGA|nr:hypothetical protein BDM02DRAFT_2771199 [Thelephora ganbajun]